MPLGEDIQRIPGHVQSRDCPICHHDEQARCYPVLASSSAEQKELQIPLPDFQEAQLSFPQQPRAVVPGGQSPIQGEHGIQKNTVYRSQQLEAARQSSASLASAFAVCGVGLAQDPVHSLASVMGVGFLGFRGQEGTGIYSSCNWRVLKGQ